MSPHRTPRRTLLVGTLATSLAVTLASCASASGGGEGDDRPLYVVGFAVPEAANEAIEAKFVETPEGEGVTFSGSYGASGDQSRKVVDGADADYVHFSLEGDVTRLVEAGIVAEDWNQNETQGIVSDSVVVLVVPEGNPDDIQGWDDLTRDDVDIITPDPDSSGSARWNILGAYGHAIAAGGSEEEAAAYLTDVFANVAQWAGSGREATEAFDQGIGNVLISYENEAILARQEGKPYDYVVPDTTLLIENPGAVTVDAHPAAQDWLDFVLSEEGQTEFVRKGFRPVIDGVEGIEVEGANDPSDPFPTPENLLTIADDFGGWSAVNEKFFADGALVQQLREAASQR
ncbi:sulfate ABC transporter substrate-binding protein [Nocardioides sp. ChNu-153]|uniref:sulfate ABC transporter substrate-binding protein n=1 Tax=unclassified Nocardioides TaxID=2615069 RepID=UPI002406E7B3|nr:MULTISPECIES: sulfate ABC transporter substrate-binding protein [unclassified Nocardioides]MDF9714685.1 sulfate ABC transporter substrate-binding protein [Nocardioides sp. ChNu-99]MDN7119782.1 sulfate ABC transporter substrate-binding protein [Nocardioides sp. ChNu-153]